MLHVARDVGVRHEPARHAREVEEGGQEVEQLHGLRDAAAAHAPWRADSERHVQQQVIPAAAPLLHQPVVAEEIAVVRAERDGSPLSQPQPRQPIHQHAEDVVHVGHPSQVLRRDLVGEAITKG